MTNGEFRLAADSLPTDYCLRVAKGSEFVGRTWALATVTTFGRHPSSDILVLDPRVAHTQFILRWHVDKRCHTIHEAWFRQVLVNDSPVLESEVIELKIGDRINVANTIFVYELQADNPE